MSGPTYFSRPRQGWLISGEQNFPAVDSVQPQNGKDSANGPLKSQPFDSDWDRITLRHQKLAVLHPNIVRESVDKQRSKVDEAEVLVKVVETQIEEEETIQDSEDVKADQSVDADWDRIISRHRKLTEAASDVENAAASDGEDGTHLETSETVLNIEAVVKELAMAEEVSDEQEEELTPKGDHEAAP